MKFSDWQHIYLQQIFQNNDKDSSKNDLCTTINKETPTETHVHRDSTRGINTFDKFKLLMWKNILLQRRHKMQTIIQILMPILFTANLLFMRSLVEPEIDRNNTFYNHFDVDVLYMRNSTYVPVKEWKLIYYPRNDIFEKLLVNVAQKLELDGVLGVDSPEEVEKIMMRHQFLAGVIFDHSTEIIELPKNLIYALRFPSECRCNVLINPLVYNWQTNSLFPIYSGGGPRGKSSDDGGAPSYKCEGFLPIQHAIAQTYMRMNSIGIPDEDGHMPDIKMQRFPYPPHVFDVLLDGFEKATGIFIMLSFVYPIISTVRYIAVEKEKQLKEIMKIMGMPVWLHWATWFVRTMIFMLISISCMVALLKIPLFDTSIAVFTHSNWFTIWVFLFVYSITMITFCFMLSVLCTKANTASALAGLVWFISYVPFVFLSRDHLRLPLLVEMIACLSPNMAMAYGFKMVVDMERSGFGLQWSNFWGVNGSNNELTVGITICCMLITSLLFLLVALYIEKLYPGEYGVPEKWNFPFKAKFWTNQCIPHKFHNDRPSSIRKFSENFEEEPLDSVAGVRVKNLRKVFDHGKVACKNVTFNMFCDQITVLLGHNGAGKSTTIKMLTGMIPPTSGTAIVNGYDIRTDLKKARESLGICPQHNILFDELTVGEHIEIYSRLKGLNWNAVQKEIKKYVKLLNLESKIDTPSKSLSGGMKRKLAFGIALCGDSKVVLCDEPTSGVDPSARRELWDLIQSEKFGRTIILTTHFMDEADVLGDRIAIMADGEVKCCGTPFFLKKRFGSGYRLTCATKEGCDSNKVTQVLQEYIPEIELVAEITGELSYSLPDEHTDKFGKMFERIENDLDTLQIDRFGLSTTELEEVFLKVGSDNQIVNKSELSDGSYSTVSDVESIEYELLHGLRLRINQCYAMFKKRYYCWINDLYTFITQNLIAVIFIAISIACVHMAKNFSVLSKMEISLKDYGKTVTMLQTPVDDLKFKRVLEEYRNDVKDGHILDEFSDDIQEHFLELGAQIRIRTNTRYLVGLSTFNDSNSLVAWFNNQLFHTAPLSLNILHNAILRANLDDDYSIEISNWPIPFTPDSKKLLIGNGDDMGTQLAVNMTFVMAFISALYVMFYIREKASKAKLLQFISGIDASTFWILSFFFDIVTYMLTSIIVCLAVYAFQESGWSTIDELMPLFIIFSIFGLSSLTVTLVSSFLFSTTSYGFVSLTIIFIFTGNSFFNLINILSLPALDLTETANMLKWIFLAFPHYALGYSLFNLNQLKMLSEVCRLKFQQKQMMSNDTFFPEMNPLNFTFTENSTHASDHWKNSTFLNDPEAVSVGSCDPDYYAWDEPGLGRSLTYMVGTTIIFFIILCTIECNILSSFIYYIRDFSRRKTPTKVSNTAIDNDVKNERRRVNKMTRRDLQGSSLVLRNLTKSYGDFLAVNGICLAVKSGECFGLLGVNGAGKTTTFKMITGDTSISSGDVFINGLKLKTQLSDIHKLIGYCPQFDALLDNLTGTQTLEIFGLLRGYRKKDISAMSGRLAKSLNFTKHIDKVIKSYSGGNKRKLSTAIALLGNPAVAYLDEPSSGMDPGSKRSLWNVVSQACNAGTSIVLTSHSMEECEALCTRIAIMVNGEFKCLGSAQHLKNQFSKGFILTVKVRLSDDQIQRGKHISQISYFIHEHFTGAYLKEQYQGLLTFYLPQTSELKWSSLFDYMENVKRKLNIEDYFISQTTLEQVFLSFTRSHDKQNDS